MSHNKIKKSFFVHKQERRGQTSSSMQSDQCHFYIFSWIITDPLDPLWHQDYTIFFKLNSMEYELFIKAKILKLIFSLKTLKWCNYLANKFYVLKLVGILTNVNWINFMLSTVRHEKFFNLEA